MSQVLRQLRDNGDLHKNNINQAQLNPFQDQGEVYTERRINHHLFDQQQISTQEESSLTKIKSAKVKHEMKIILKVPYLILLFVAWLSLSAGICFLNSFIFGLVIWFKVLAKTNQAEYLKTKNQIKFVLFVVLIFLIPIFFFSGAIPGLLFPIINLLYKEKITFQTDIIVQIWDSLFKSTQIF